MKNFRVLYMTALVVFATLTACSSDDDSGPASDCLNCSVSGVPTNYCYVAGSEFYTITIAGQPIEVDLEEGETWEEVKEGLQTLCDE